MNRSHGPALKTLASCLAAIGLLGAAASAAAQEVDYEYKPKLKIDSARRYFVNVGYTYIKPNDKFEDVRDATGYVVKYREVNNYTVPNQQTYLGRGSATGTIPGAPTALNTPYKNLFGPTVTSLDQAMRSDALDRGLDPATFGLGTPTGVNQKAGSAGSPTLSLGVYLDEERKWATEAYVAALPFENKIYGAGRIGTAVAPDASDPTDPSGNPVTWAQAKGVDLGEIASTKQLGPLVMLRRYFGAKDAKFRPSVGVAATYILFFDTKASASLEQYVGGSTKIKIKNTWGVGPVVNMRYALGSNWSLNGTLGYLYMKAKATITTDVDPTMMGNSAASLQAAYDLGVGGSGLYSTYGGLLVARDAGSLVPTLQALARIRAAEAGAANPNAATSLGTYVRTVEGRLNPWVFNVSVGYDF